MSFNALSSYDYKNVMLDKKVNEDEINLWQSLVEDTNNKEKVNKNQASKNKRMAAAKERKGKKLQQKNVIYNIDTGGKSNVKEDIKKITPEEVNVTTTIPITCKNISHEIAQTTLDEISMIKHSENVLMLTPTKPIDVLDKEKEVEDDITKKRNNESTKNIDVVNENQQYSSTTIDNLADLELNTGNTMTVLSQHHNSTVLSSVAEVTNDVGSLTSSSIPPTINNYSKSEGYSPNPDIFSQSPISPLSTNTNINAMPDFPSTTISSPKIDCNLIQEFPNDEINNIGKGKTLIDNDNAREDVINDIMKNSNVNYNRKKTLERQYTSSPIISNDEEDCDRGKTPEVIPKDKIDLLSPIYDNIEVKNERKMSRKNEDYIKLRKELQYKNDMMRNLKKYSETSDSDIQSYEFTIDRRDKIRDKAKDISKIYLNKELKNIHMDSRNQKGSVPLSNHNLKTRHLSTNNPKIQMSRINEVNHSNINLKNSKNDNDSDFGEDFIDLARKRRFMKNTSSNISGRPSSRGVSSDCLEDSTYRSLHGGRPRTTMPMPMPHMGGPPYGGMHHPGMMMPPPQQPYDPYYMPMAPHFNPSIGNGRHSANLYGRYTPNGSYGYNNYYMGANSYSTMAPYGYPPTPQGMIPTRRARSGVDPALRRTTDHIIDPISGRSFRDESQDYSFCESSQSESINKIKGNKKNITGNINQQIVPQQQSQQQQIQEDDVVEEEDEEIIEEEDDEGESEEEMAQYTQNSYGYPYPVKSLGYPAPPSMNGIGSDEYYFFGVIQLAHEKVLSILKRNPPPQQYYELPAIEKAAFLFYFQLYKRHFKNVEHFHNLFNREYYRYTSEGATSEDALKKICEHTQLEYLEKVAEEKKRNYELCQKSLFPDDCASPDSRGRASICDNDYASDGGSIASSIREPYKYKTLHAVANFIVGGRCVVLNPVQSENYIVIQDSKNLYFDEESQKIYEHIHTFKGPLIVGQTKTHTVRLFIQRQIDRIINSALYEANPSSGDANDCILVWRLLETLVQQHGRVTGPDLARLLLQNYKYLPPKGQLNSNVDSDYVSDQSCNQRLSSIELFTRFLLGGHIEEAVNCAIDCGLHADALILARRMFPNDTSKIEMIENKLLANRLPNNPVMTLISVASEMPVPVLTNPPTDDSSSWRAHAAIVLANLSTPTAMNTVYHLGQALSRKDFHAAADFCFLAVHLLAGYNPFIPPTLGPDEDKSYRRHIKLIHASIPDDKTSSANTVYGWSVLDFQATEIYEYALNLAFQHEPASIINSPYYYLTQSNEFQLCKMQYALLLSEYSGFSRDAFTYCLETAKNIWNKLDQFPIQNLEQLSSLAEHIQFIAGSEDNEASWIPLLNQAIQQRKIMNSHICGQEYNTTPTVNKEQQFFENTVKSSNIENHIPTSPVTSNYGVDQVDIQQPYTPSLTNEMEKLKITTPEPTIESTTNDSVSQNSFTPSNIPSKQQNTMENHHNDNVVKPISCFDSLNTPPQNQGTYNNEPETPIIPIIQPEVRERTVSTSSSIIQSRRENSIEPPKFDYSTVNNFSNSKQQENINNYQNSFKSNDSYQNMMKKEEKDNNKDKKNQIETLQSKEHHGSSGGLFGSLKNKIVKLIPTGNEMILPDDSNPVIRWDEKLGKYVGEGIAEEEPVAPPPLPSSMSMPTINNSTTQEQQQPPVISGGLKEARKPGKSRYYNPLSDTTTGGNTSMMAPAMDTSMMMPTTNFGFIPTMPESSEDTTVDPFSAPTSMDEIQAN
uniref:Protein transport protein sec16 n=1 Tax=Parastrongyloides trichosuri TaxID=131310 RepID=A0A0N4ZQC6_PARTI